MSKGYRFCSIPVARESVANALLVLQRYRFIADGSAKESPGGVAYTIDLGALPPGDGPAIELMVRREVERAVSLHTVTP